MSISSKRIRNLALAGIGSLAIGATSFGTSAFALDQQVPAEALAPVAAPAVASIWSADALTALKAEVAASAGEGLDPTAYGVEALDGRAEGAETDRIATSIAVALATNYARGTIDDPGRLDWHIERPAVDVNALAAGILAAARSGSVRNYIRAQLPGDPRYVALRDAYAATAASDVAMRDRLRANMERWRWMPRDLGKDHIYVNVPSYTLAVIDEGKPVSTYTVVVGAPKTPTPQIEAEARSVVVNPWWNVPRSIARGMKAPAARGFVVSDGAIRQRPGPGNALGKVKIDMPNPHSIYLHDTPSKALFARESRAFSHGCIRVKDVDRLAIELVQLDGQKTGEVERALATTSTRTVALQHERPVYLVYFTADVGADGHVKMLEDPYGRDARLLANLERVRMATNTRRARTSTAA